MLHVHLFGKDAAFYDLFEGLAAKVVSCAERLRRLAAHYPESEDEIRLIHEDELAADEMIRHLLDRLTLAFLPPIDGEDVHALAGGLDDIIDHIDSLARRFPLYNVDAMEPTFVRQTDVLVDAAARLDDAVHKLRKSRHLSDLRETLIEIHHQESIGDDNHHAALSRLFDGSCDAIFVLKWKELHTLIEDAIDACEDVGNILERIVLKNT